MVGDGLALAMRGLAVGVPAATAIGFMSRNVFFGVKPYDPLTLGAVVLLLLTVAALACWLPARRATRINPVEALRAE